MSDGRPKTLYAKSGDLSIAYTTIGDGPFDLVLAPPYATHLELGAECAPLSRFVQRLASFSRLILFDKRGTGLSDPVPQAATLEERMDDVRAVMDAAESERASLLGISEGCPMSILFAAAHPERTSALVLYGGMARSTWAPDHPFGSTREALLESAAEFVMPHYGEGIDIEIFAPSLADDPQIRDWWGRLERYAASPAMAAMLFAMFLDIDVRHVLPTINVPTLVLHRKGDRVVNVRAGRWLAEHIQGARFVELDGIDHVPWAGDADSVVDEVQEFLTGERRAVEPDRILATVMFTDIVGSTERAANLGDRRWRDLLESHQAAVRRELDRYRGREIKSTGDGILATFDGPARAIRCGASLAKSLESLGIQIRVGLHTGEVELHGDDVAGIAVHIAARVITHAGPGEVVVSSTVKDLVAGSGITFSDRGTHTLKGVPDEWRLFTVETC
jgi:class 3 adenylate cyclase